MLNTTAVQFSEADKIKEIKIPNVMSPELAEEIGVHSATDVCQRERIIFL